MNKRIFQVSALVATALLFASCAGEEDDIFDHSAIERLDASKSKYTERLVSSAGGWTMEYYPEDVETDPQGVGYLLLAKFNADQTVTVGMKNAFTYDEYKEDTSVWEMIADAGPVLTFNTYNTCLHAFSDPNDLPFTSSSETGNGAEGDYEFVVIEMEEDAQFAMLKGKKRGTYCRMTRLPEGTDFEEYINDVQNFKKSIFPESAPNFNVLTVGDSVMKVEDIYDSFCNIYPYDGDNIADESYHTSIITKRDGKYYLRFRETINGNDDNSEQEFVYDEANDIFLGVENSANTLAGANPTEFLFSGTNWTFRRSSSMSEAMSSLFESMYDEFKGSSMTLNSVSMSFTDSELSVSLTYRYNRRDVSVRYLFDVAKQDDGTYTVTYREPYNEGAGQVSSTLTSVQTFLDALAGTYTAEGAVTNFDLSTMQLNIGSDGSKWVVLNYQN